MVVGMFCHSAWDSFQAHPVGVISEKNENIIPTATFSGGPGQLQLGTDSGKQTGEGPGEPRKAVQGPCVLSATGESEGASQSTW